MGQGNGSDELIDPEFDENIAGAGGQHEPVPGPFSISQLVLGVHLLAILALAPFLLLAVQGGNTPQVLTLSLLITLVLVAGVYTSRVAERREP